MSVNDPSTVKVTRHHIPPHGTFPNSRPNNLPLYIYHRAFTPTPSRQLPPAIPRSVAVPQWTYTMYPTAHFHSTTPEVLYIVSGSAELCFGGLDNPGRVRGVFSKGDVVVVLAGVAHQLVEEREGEGGFEMVGAYPPGKSWDMCYGDENGGKRERREVETNIVEAGWLEGDPVWGDRGPVVDDLKGE